MKKNISLERHNYFIGKIDNHQYDNGEGYQAENDETDNEFKHNRLLVCFDFFCSKDG